MRVWAVFQELELLVHFRPVETTNSSTGPTEMSDRWLEEAKNSPLRSCWCRHFVNMGPMKRHGVWLRLRSSSMISPLLTSNHLSPHFRPPRPLPHKYPWVPIFGEVDLRLMLSLFHMAALWLNPASAAISSSQCLAFWETGKNEPGSVTLACMTSHERSTGVLTLVPL